MAYPWVVQYLCPAPEVGLYEVWLDPGREILYTCGPVLEVPMESLEVREGGLVGLPARRAVTLRPASHLDE